MSLVEDLLKRLDSLDRRLARLESNITLAGVNAAHLTSTNTVVDTERIQRTTSGTAAAGIGQARVVFLPDASGNLEEAANIDVVLTNATHGAEVGQMLLGVRGTSVLTLTAGKASAAQLESTIADGTAPLVVTSTTKVTNLNVDQCDGQHLSTSDGPTFTHIHLTAADGTAGLSVQGTANTLIRHTLLNVNTGANRRVDMQIGTGATGSEALYFGVDQAPAGYKAYLDNRSGGPFQTQNSGVAGVTFGTGGELTVASSFGCNTKAAQSAYASGGAITDTADATYSANEVTMLGNLKTLCNNIRAALVANGIMEPGGHMAEEPEHGIGIFTLTGAWGADNMSIQLTVGGQWGEGSIGLQRLAGALDVAAKNTRDALIEAQVKERMEAAMAAKAGG